MNGTIEAAVTPAATLLLLRIKHVQALVPVHRVTLWRMIERGDFPAPLKINGRTILWRADEIQAWVDAKSSERKGVTIEEMHAYFDEKGGQK